jgi:hypothetical protein
MKSPTVCAWGIPYPTVTITPTPEPVCICTPGNYDNTQFCSVCDAYSDCCTACLKEPKCECIWTDVDQTDAADCQLHDPDSHYNWLLAKAEKAAAARMKPVQREEVIAVFDDILNSFKGAA